MKKKLNEIIYNPLFSGSAVMILGSSFASVLNYLYHFIMGKLLIDPSKYGELVVLISVMGLLGIIPSSFNLVIIKYISAAKNNDEIKSLTKWFRNKTLQFELFFLFIILLISPFITSFLRINNSWYIFLVVFSFFFSVPAMVNRSVLQGLLRFKEMIFSVLAETIAKLLLGVIFVYIGFSVGGALLGIAFASFIGWYLSSSFLKMSIQEVDSRLPNFKSIIGFTLPVIVQSLATTSLYTSDVILVKHFFTSYEAGIYAALSTLSKIIFFGTGPIGAVMFPLVSQRQSRGENYRKIFRYSLFATLALSLCLLIFYWFFPSFVITRLYTSSYLQAKDLLVWFSIFISLFTLSSLLVNYNLSLGKTRVVLFPLIAAISQIVIIWFNHQNLLTVIMISIGVTALLLLSMLIYSSYEDKSNISNSSGLQARENNS